jgi:tRNA A-37 threonylcarbamoyl transferase component Bud32
MPRHLLPSGEIIGEDYQIVKLLGYGGMGEVYLARHHLTGQQVAIKVLAMHLSEEVDLRIRFLDEARILARLDHPNIVMLHNFKQDRGRLLILMQYVDGLGLDHILAREGPMHPERAALMFAPLCDALHHAHENAIIHRDLKPSNILVDRSGKARLTDFGIAKLTEGGANLTRTGTRVGTSWFMSPEQGLNQPADARSDIYALGVTLYNALAGRLPFGGASEYEVIKGHVERPPPPIYRSEHPFAQAIEEVVSRALAKRPEERYQNGVQMRDALLDALAAFGDENGVRSATGTGLFRVHPERGAEGPPGGSTGARARRTVVDEVLPVPTGELRVATPPLGGRSGVGEEKEPGAARPTPPLRGAGLGEPGASPEVESGPHSTGGPSPYTPPGRPAAPGKLSESTGILRGDPAADGPAGSVSRGDRVPEGEAPADARAGPVPAPHRTPVGLTSLPLEVPSSSPGGPADSSPTAIAADPSQRASESSERAPEPAGDPGSGGAGEAHPPTRSPAASEQAPRPRHSSTSPLGERVIPDDPPPAGRRATAEFPQPPVPPAESSTEAHGEQEAEAEGVPGEQAGRDSER